MATNTSDPATANLSNWMTSPYNHWAFHNIDKVLKTEIIKAPGNASPLPKALRDFSGFSLSLGQPMDLATLLTATATDGLLVLHKGQIVYETYANGNNASSKHIAMSVTKSVVGLLFGILQAQQKLHADDLVSKYVPEVADTKYAGVTIRQLLDMRSGITEQGGMAGSRAAAGWAQPDGSEKFADLHSFIKGYQTKPADHDGFEYVSLNTDLLGWVAERATGKKFAELLHEHLWVPMGAESDALMTVDREGSARAAGGLCLTLPDLARIGLLIAHDGKGVVPASWVQDIKHGGDRGAWEKGAWSKMSSGSLKTLAYRTCCTADSQTEIVIGMGIHGQLMMVDGKNEIVMVKFSSQPEGISQQGSGLALLAFQEFKRILNDQSK